IDLGDILSIDVTEMLIMQNLMRYPNSELMAIDLRNILNSMLTGKKKISSSSFYNKVKKLKTQGFINFKQDKSGKMQELEITDKAILAIQEIKKLSIFATSDIFDHLQEIIPEYLREAKIDYQGKPIYDNVLFINLEDGLDARIMNSLTVFGKNNYLVRSSNNEDIPVNVELKQIEQTNNMILMPNDFFDAVLIIGYDCLFADNQDGTQWLQEAYRVLKPGGFMNVNSVTEVPDSNHFIIRSMVDDLHKSPQFRFITSKQLITEMAEVGMKDYQTFESNGMLLGYGYK
ncbi:MAG: class I SAM-dependent methyltransferase, partial [Candidatus Hodarchaeales archaeon]